MKTAVVLMLLTALTGCTAMAERQRQQQEANAQMLSQMTPEQRAYYQLEVARLQIEQQRANREQIESGLRMMQPQPLPSQGLHCTSIQQGPFTNTDCH